MSAGSDGKGGSVLQPQATFRMSVVIPAFNEEKLLSATLEAVRTAVGAWERRGWAHEVIVCDNNSSDCTAAIAREAGVRVVFEPVNQIGRARNAGAAVAVGDWLVFLDADSRPTEALFDAVADTVASGRVVAGGSIVKLDGGGPGLAVLTGVWNWTSRLFRWMAGSFIFVERAAFVAVGGFNEALYAAEEIDLSRRLKPLARRGGRRLAILTEAPLLTSARKASLYPPWALARFSLRGLLRPGATLRNREACSPWYDGRR